MQPGAVFWRRRAAALAALALLVLIPLLVLLTAGGGEDDAASGDRASAASEKESERKAEAERPQLPRGGRSIFPESRVVAFYGAPQDDELGVLGIGSPDRAAKKLATVTKRYSRKSRPAVPAMELIAVVAAAHPGEGDRYNLRQSDAVIRRYLKAARKAKALLLLDIQPGHADFLAEAMRLEKWLKEPDVGLALDPEWATPGAVPGTQIGSVDAKTVNAVSAWLDRIVQRDDLPQKLFVVHQFTDDMISNRERLKQRDGLEITLNVDGFGDRPNKLAKYREFTSHAVRFHDGFKLFYKEDTNLMTPGAVLDLRPPPDFVVYE
ncbi:MAG TPA: hypothetical protein VN238_00895 [Solirubrobacteraceae bacterium]|nr:hypothetical protein [Solirubrobacteraceae bacterium]